MKIKSFLRHIHYIVPISVDQSKDCNHPKDPWTLASMKAVQSTRKVCDSMKNTCCEDVFNFNGTPIIGAYLIINVKGTFSLPVEI